jgi:hypothetical protein
MADKGAQISATVPPALRTRLQHAAIDLDRKQSDIITEALEGWLDQHKL